MAPGPQPAEVSTFTISSPASSFNILVKDYLASHNEYQIIVCGALVFDSRDRLLIVQRAASDFMPNLWEVPGGACDEGETILNGAARELWEESGLIASTMLHPVGGAYIFGTPGEVWCKHTFEIQVEDTERVKLDPEEHQRFLWVTEEDCRNRRVEDDGELVEIQFTSSGQEATIFNGFQLRKAAKLEGQ
ncbi:NUDIX hydrolase domain-like protein [Tricladium varicosporioides]|nr:NUDIX hydrolase domain-like protein [Hymenoscyphus varicosporioides]